MANDLQSPVGPTVSPLVAGSIANEVHSSPDQSYTLLVSGIIADAQHLIQQQFAMLRQEILSDFRKTKDAAGVLAVGVGIALVGGVLLVLTLPLLLHWAAPELPLWACFALVGGVLAALGGVLVYTGLKRFESFNPLPDQSFDAFKENLQWTNTQAAQEPMKPAATQQNGSTTVKKVD